MLGLSKLPSMQGLSELLSLWKSGQSAQSIVRWVVSYPWRDTVNVYRALSYNGRYSTYSNKTHAN